MISRKSQDQEKNKITELNKLENTAIKKINKKYLYFLIVLLFFVLIYVIK